MKSILLIAAAQSRHVWHEGPVSPYHPGFNMPKFQQAVRDVWNQPEEPYPSYDHHILEAPRDHVQKYAVRRNVAHSGTAEVGSQIVRAGNPVVPRRVPIG